MRRKCRIWWPKELSSSEPLSSNLLFGWFLSSSSASLDIVVAFASTEVSLSHNRSSLEVQHPKFELCRFVLRHMESIGLKNLIGFDWICSLGLFSCLDTCCVVLCLNSSIAKVSLKFQNQASRFEKKVHLVKKLLINVGRKMADDVKSDCLFSLSTMWARWRCLGCSACHSHSCRH